MVLTHKNQKIIGIGIQEDSEHIFRDIITYAGPCTIQCYVSPEISIPPEFKIYTNISDNPEESLITDLFSGQIHAAIRGTLESHKTLKFLKEKAGVKELERIVLLETPDGHKFFLAPVGVDEGWSVEQKISIINRSKIFCKMFGLSDTVAILSGGRLTDIGRHPVVDQTLADGELIARLTGAIHYGILIEEAVKTSGLIIAPDGISGNLIFRTLLFLGRGRSHGAPVLNIGKIFVDTSRVNPDYHYALNLASVLIG